MKEIAIGCLTAIILTILIPIITFAAGCLCGLILKWFVGDIVVNGLNLLFNTTRFVPEMLPTTCGALAVVGSFFKTSYKSS